MVIAPDTRTRLSIAELGGITLEGEPSRAAARYASTGEEVEFETADGIKPASVPDLVTVSWEVSGAPVSAQLDVVATRTCTLEDLKAYRADQYRLSEEPEDRLFQARAHAEEVIERECHRFLQPVVREGWCDRPNCRNTSLLIADGQSAYDMSRVLRAVDEDGNPARVKVASGVQLDVSGLRVRSMASVTVVMGMNPIPSEARDAVLALAAWYLVPSANPANATSTSTEAGVLNFVIGGVNGAATSLPEVNALIARYGVRDYQVG